MVCSPARTYAVPMAPPMAAAALGRPVPTLADLLDEVRWPEPAVDVAWLETVGGPRSPIASDGDAVDLVAAVEPRKVVLVADAGLGTINAVRLSVAPFRELGHEPIVVLNRFDAADDLHRRNAAWLHDLGIAAVLTARRWPTCSMPWRPADGTALTSPARPGSVPDSGDGRTTPQHPLRRLRPGARALVAARLGAAAVA